MANYSAEIVSTSLAESKEKHTPSVRVQLRTIRNLDLDQETEKQFIADLWLSDNAVERTVKTLRDLGFQGGSMVELNDPNTMAGLLCEISTEMQEYNGNSQERVKFINKPGSFANRGLRACPDDMAKSIAQRYDACLRSGKFHKPAQQKAAYGAQRVQNKPAPQPETTESDDDLPF
jgi:hypothetical protein